VIVAVDYYRRNCDRKRGKRHKGIYPALALLGIYERCTPCLTSEVSILTATLGSLAETQQVLSEQGNELNEKTIRHIAYRAAERARLLQKMGHFGFKPDETMAGRRVVVSADGGRIRLREKKRGPKTKKGRNHYNGAWREPKLFIIYVVDDEGNQSDSFAPIIDGLIQGPNALFALLQQYLKKLDIQEADQLLFVSDGAKWIWNRIPSLIQDLGIEQERVHLLIDFFHAVQHIHKVAALCKDWSKKQRTQWANKHRKLLYNGHVDQVIEAIRPLCKGRRAKTIRTQLNYFINHQYHMAYGQILALNLPIGSGAIESAIRRVVNLRLKGPAIFWTKSNAQSVLFLRAFYKSGRWPQLQSLALSPLFSHSF